MYRWIEKTLIFAVTLGLSGLLEAQAVQLSGGRLSLTVKYRTTYDSNILKYSIRDRERFLDNIEVYRSPINALDDIRSDFKISTSYAKKIWSKRTIRLSLTGNFAHYLLNPIKNFGWFSLTGKQEFTKNFSASLNYFYDIDYYIRNYRDIHTDKRQRCEFSMDQWTGRIYFLPVKDFELIGFIKFKKYAYNEYFTEYDSDYTESGFEVVYRSGPWRFAGGYSLANNDNIGFNAAASAKMGWDFEDNEEGNGDYQQDSYNCSLRYSFRLKDKRSRILLNASLKDRYYTTNRDYLIDPIHSDRHDVMTSVELSLRINLNRALTLELGSSYNNRRSEAPNPIVHLVKDYDHNTGWVELGYEIK